MKNSAKLLLVGEAATILKCCTRTVRYHAETGALSRVKGRYYEHEVHALKHRLEDYYNQPILQPRSKRVEAGA